MNECISLLLMKLGQQDGVGQEKEDKEDLLRKTNTRESPFGIN